MECSVCCEECIEDHYLCNEELKSKKKCNFHACIKCYKKYLLESTKEPHCMACRIIIPFEKQLECFTKKWLFGKYKNHREEQLMHIEKQRFPQDLMKIENNKEIKRLETEKDEIYNHYGKIIKEIKDEMTLKTRELNIKINEKRGKKKMVKFDYNYQCPCNTCNGILNNDFICVLCDKKTCKKCYTINENEEMHECEPEQIETFKKIKDEAKPCPSCGEFISKISGCDQMFCITCGTSFSWKSGNIEKGVIHNPHAHQYFQNNPEAREMYLNGVQGGINNGACRGHLPQIYSFRNHIPEDLRVSLTYMHRKVAEFRNYYRNKYNQIIENDILQDGSFNEDLRLRKLNKFITERRFKSQLHARIKKYNFKKQIYPHIRSAFDITELFFWEINNTKGTNEEVHTRIRNIYQSIQDLINETNKNILNITNNFGYHSNIKLNYYMSGFPTT